MLFSLNRLSWSPRFFNGRYSLYDMLDASFSIPETTFVCKICMVVSLKKNKMSMCVLWDKLTAFLDCFLGHAFREVFEVTIASLQTSYILVSYLFVIAYRLVLWPFCIMLRCIQNIYFLSPIVIALH